MKITTKREESGQVIVLLAFGMIALLAMTALALDGGMIYSDRRYDQNAADAAAYAGAGAAAMRMENDRVSYNSFNCGSIVNNAKADAVQAALTSATSNNFTIEDNLDTQHGVVVECGMDARGSYFDKHLDIHTMISSTLQTAFAHMFYKGDVRNTVDAVARVRPRNDLSYGFAITSLSDDCGDGILFDGDAGVTVHVTGIFSNSCMTTNGGVNVRTEPEDPGNPRPAISYVEDGGFDNNGSGSIVPAPSDVGFSVPRIPVDPPNCYYSGMTDMADPTWDPHSDELTIDPGRYSNIKVNAGNTLILNPGLYCVTTEFTGLGGTIKGDGVTIFMPSGTLNMGGNNTVQLSAPTTDTQPALRNMLFYAAEENTNNHSLQGGADSWYTGSIYAPYGEVAIGGNSEVNPTYTTQIVANSVKIHGTADLEIYYDDALVHMRPAYLELYR